ncbi:hypothetical protein [Rhodopirellula sallentina]|uniref:hypothetical protein n=1 Tax=Rhodopirellula sallentina TaxID=1263869 RepID=UPI001F2F7BFD|nr:hypothetical protein [Rhodopirellula sallentina]
MSTATASKQECIQNCQECQTIVSDMLTATCLAEGGDHVEQKQRQTDARLHRCMQRVRRIHEPQQRLPRSLLQSVCGNLQGVRGQLRASRRHGQVRRMLPQMRRKLQLDGSLEIPHCLQP